MAVDTLANGIPGSQSQSATPIVVDSAEADSAEIMALAREAQRIWGAMSLPTRARRLSRLAANIAASIDPIADTIHEENGKPRAEAVAHEAVTAIQFARHTCHVASAVLSAQAVPLESHPSRSAELVRQPFGVVLAISPWNLPFFIPLSQVLPALLAGNAVVLKPSELTPDSARLIEKLLGECGLPEGLFQVAYGDGSLGQRLIEAQPDKVLFTGSVATGRKVMAACARLPIPVSLELGGVDAMIVRADADLEFTASAAAWGATFNAGQACASVERLLVHRSIHDALVVRIADKMNRIDRSRELGPAVDDKQLHVWQEHMLNARNAGATQAAGGTFLPGRKLEPTLLTGSQVAETEAWRSETFGPVLAVLPFDDDDEAISMHNATEYGLTASIFTADLDAAKAMAAKLRAGVVCVNDVAATCYGSPEIPWGGVGLSGFGRSHGDEGLLDATWTKVIEVPKFAGPNAKRPWWYPYGPDLEATMSKLGRALAVENPVRRAVKVAKAGVSIVPLLTRNPRL
ncbi:MAG: aldehyde dehydrogenase family protein [Candidatus Nanopelagicales bacterium]|nr:aldehyde dehydrogenase family protein [Candidatus Nanopelagicales bacterium]MDZ4249742.1 aldehyde dehydrogenase family protein [Candidatus Nanopelagicales bacterium]MDZ7577680.1 aldehyde dehydrogenase family protein [Candidatus Nanopelagicales bacterium]